MAHKSGIYKITHVDTGKSYVGASCNLDARRYSHYRELHLNKHICQEMQADFNASACGNSAVNFQVIELCPVDALHEKERLHIAAISPAYNRNAAGGGLHKKITEKTRQKMRDRMTGNQIRYVGVFKTPFGDFRSSCSAVANSNGAISQSGIWRACRYSDTVITRHIYAKTRYLNQNFDDTIIGLTWADMGFGFTPALDA